MTISIPPGVATPSTMAAATPLEATPGLATNGLAGCAVPVDANPSDFMRTLGEVLATPRPQAMMPPIGATLVHGALEPRALLDRDKSLPARSRATEDDPLDRTTRHLSELAAPQIAMEPAPAPNATIDAGARVSLEDMLPALVRKIAWSREGRRGAVRMELGAGALAGGTLVVHADEGRVRVDFKAPPGTDAEAWRARIAERLARRGIEVESIDVE